VEDVEIVERQMGKWERGFRVLYRVVGGILLIVFVLFLLGLFALLWYLPV
jgi:hypothetical protein